MCLVSGSVSVGLCGSLHLVDCGLAGLLHIVGQALQNSKANSSNFAILQVQGLCPVLTTLSGSMQPLPPWDLAIKHAHHPGRAAIREEKGQLCCCSKSTQEQSTAL